VLFYLRANFCVIAILNAFHLASTVQQSHFTVNIVFQCLLCAGGHLQIVCNSYAYLNVYKKVVKAYSDPAAETVSTCSCPFSHGRRKDRNGGLDQTDILNLVFSYLSTKMLA